MAGRPLDDKASSALDVPVRPLGGPQGDRSARRASLAAIAVALGIVLFAVPKGSPADDVRPTPSAVAQASPGATARPTPRRSPRPTLPPLPEVPNQVLIDAPHPAFYERRGDDLQIRHWVPGLDELQLAATIPGAFDGPFGGQGAVALPSPDGRAVLILTFDQADGAESPVRLLTDAAGITWEGTTTTPGQAVWSVDSRYLGLVEDNDTWLIIDTAANPPSPLTIDLPAWTPDTESSPRPFEPLPLSGLFPIGFAADATYLYGGEYGPEYGPEGKLRSLIRIAVDTSRVEPVDVLPPTGPKAPAVVGFGPPPERDPMTGRTAAFDQGGPVVREPDGTVVFRLEVPGAILAMVWSNDGRLIAVETEGREEIGTVRVTPWEPDGSQGPPLLVTSHPAWVNLTAIRDGYLLLGFVNDFPSASLHPVRMVLLRLDDRATSTIDLDTDQLARLVGIGWYEPPAIPSLD